MLQDGGVKIWRPRQVRICTGPPFARVELADTHPLLPRKVYVGAGKRDYVSFDQRPVIRGSQVEPLSVPHSGYVRRHLMSLIDPRTHFIYLFAESASEQNWQNS